MSDSTEDEIGGELPDATANIALTITDELEVEEKQSAP